MEIIEALKTAWDYLWLNGSDAYYYELFAFRALATYYVLKIMKNLGKSAALTNDTIAKIELNGIIMPQNKSQFDDRTITPDGLDEVITSAEEDSSCKGIILELNSPGGEVTASKRCHDIVARATKPVVAVASSICASGGYMIACACDYIVAESNSMVGSIGVLMNRFEYHEGLEKLGIYDKSIKAGDRKRLLSGTRAMPADEMQALEAELKKTHEEFIQLVAKGRGTEVEDIRQSADGWIYRGQDAILRHLIDCCSTEEKTSINIATEFIEEVTDSKNLDLKVVERAKPRLLQFLLGTSFSPYKWGNEFRRGITEGLIPFVDQTVAEHPEYIWAIYKP